jgi:hypothetical protein
MRFTDLPYPLLARVAALLPPEDKRSLLLTCRDAARAAEECWGCWWECERLGVRDLAGFAVALAECPGRLRVGTLSVSVSCHNLP